MRLTQKEIDVLKSSILEKDPEAKIILFGSRVDDLAKGGDIDLLIFSHRLTQSDSRSIRRAIFEKLEEQKIDITIAKDDSDPFVRIAMKNGIYL